MHKNLDFHTAKEIKGQPRLWIKVVDYFNSRKEAVSEFVLPLLKKKDLNIILTGAGSSAFIGKVIRHSFEQNLGIRTNAISTTTLVTHFKNYTSPDCPLLLISFARSGNSPESNAVIDLAEKYCDDVHHIAITCNPEGDLAQKVDSLERGFKFVLPPEAEDRALAMTGSFTGMMLAGLLISQINNFQKLKELTKSTSRIAEILFENYSTQLEDIASSDFNRILFLGSGPLLGVAKESHLKVQELTDGLVIGKHDSFLGVRHGPKVVIHDKTVVVYLFSPDPNVFRYEKDLADEIAAEDTKTLTVGLFSNKKQSDSVKCDLNILLDTSESDVPSDLYLLPYVLPSQIIGYYKSLQLGLNPDTPSENGTISRVVKGVKIYPDS